MKLRLETALADAPTGDLRTQLEAADREVDRLSGRSSTACSRCRARSSRGCRPRSTSADAVRRGRRSVARARRPRASPCSSRRGRRHRTGEPHGRRPDPRQPARQRDRLRARRRSSSRRADATDARGSRSATTAPASPTRNASASWSASTGAGAAPPGRLGTRPRDRAGADGEVGRRRSRSSAPPERRDEDHGFSSGPRPTSGTQRGEPATSRARVGRPRPALGVAGTVWLRDLERQSEVDARPTPSSRWS